MQDFSQLYPFTSHWLDLDGVRYHYLDEGPPDAPPIVMVHGNPTWSFYYRTLIPRLSQTYRVIALDHVGCGLSDKPQDYPYTLEQHIRNLERLVEHLGLRRITLALHDWGGAVGMGYATRHPQNVVRFILFNTAAFYLPAIPLVLHLARSRGLGEFLVRGLNLFARGALIWGAEQPQRLTDDVRAGYLAPYGDWWQRVAIYRFVRDIPVSAAHPTRSTVDAIDRRLGSLRDRPMIICWGARDPVFTARAFLPAWRERFPHAAVHVFEDAGHYVVEDAYARILPLALEFLERTDGCIL